MWYTVVIRELGGKCQLGSLNTGSPFAETLVLAREIIEKLVKPMPDVQDVRETFHGHGLSDGIFTVLKGLSYNLALGPLLSVITRH